MSDFYQFDACRCFALCVFVLKSKKLGNIKRCEKEDQSIRAHAGRENLTTIDLEWHNNTTSK